MARAAIASACGVHDGLSALVAQRCRFDALWASGLGVSASHGVPDASILTMTDFLHAATVASEVTSLPVIADCDTGFGDVNVVAHMVRSYERRGIAAVCIEDKRFPKRNSFCDRNELEGVPEFSAKIRAAKLAQRNDALMIIARLESLIAGFGVDHALERAFAYVEAGADAILVHSKARTPDDVLEFATRWRAGGAPVPLVVVPTTYPCDAADLEAAGIAMVIYANQALRASVAAMQRTLAAIAGSGTTKGVEDELCGVDEILDLIGMPDVERRDDWFSRTVREMRESPARDGARRHPASRRAETA